MKTIFVAELRKNDYTESKEGRHTEYMLCASNNENELIGYCKLFLERLDCKNIRVNKSDALNLHVVRGDRKDIYYHIWIEKVKII